MKHFLLPITIAAALLCACDKTPVAEPKTPCRTVEAVFYDQDATTRSSFDPVAGLVSGTAAAYISSTGELIESHSWDNGENRATFTRIPEAEVLFYAVGNRDFTWPSNSRELKTIGFDTDLKDGAVPFSSMINACKYPQTDITIGLRRLFARITLSKGDCGRRSFVASRAYAKDCPSVIRPFAGPEGNTYGDSASPEDIRLFNADTAIVLYVPKQGEYTKVIVEGRREPHDARIYDDTVKYNFRWLSEDKEIKVNIGEDGVRTLCSKITDFRELAFSTDTARIQEMGLSHCCDIYLHSLNGDSVWDVELKWKISHWDAYQYGFAAGYSLENIWLQIGDEGEKTNMQKAGSYVKNDPWYLEYVSWRGPEYNEYSYGGTLHVRYDRTEKPIPVYLETNKWSYSYITIEFEALGRKFVLKYR